MKWYLAKIIYRIICGEGNHTPQFDEQIRIVSAENDLHAFQKARKTGETEEDNFLNNNNKPVKWKFVDVTEIQLLNDLIDGAELNSRIYEQEDAGNYLKLVNDRAKNLHDLCLHNTFLPN